MRLIDADVLAESSCYAVCQECNDMYKGKNITTNCSEIRLTFLRLINDAPTVDAEPVVHGHWRFAPDDSEGVCTACCYKIYGIPYEGKYMIVPYNYCPNCGAKMDEV